MRHAVFACGLCSFLLDAFEEDRRGLVVAPFKACEFGFGGDEFAAEGACENGLRELVNVRFGRAVTGFDGVGGLEERFDATNDFLLFVERTKWDFKLSEFLCVDVRLTYSIRFDTKPEISRIVSVLNSTLKCNFELGQ